MNGFTEEKQDNKDKKKAQSCNLFCEERLSRSPELWPEKVNGITKFLSGVTILGEDHSNQTKEWLDELNNREMNLIVTFGSLNEARIIDKVRECQDIAYQLGLEEAREMTRGNLLNIFGNRHSTFLEMDTAYSNKKSPIQNGHTLVNDNFISRK